LNAAQVKARRFESARTSAKTPAPLRNAIALAEQRVQKRAQPSLPADYATATSTASAVPALCLSHGGRLTRVPPEQSAAVAERWQIAETLASRPTPDLDQGSDPTPTPLR